MLTMTAGTSNINDWKGKSLEDLIQHISDTHHAYLKNEFIRLQDFFYKALVTDGEKHEEFIQELLTVYEKIKTDLMDHTNREEEIIFPMIRDLERAFRTSDMSYCSSCSSLDITLRVMENEHRHMMEDWTQIRKLTDSYTVPEGVSEILKDLYRGLQEMEFDLVHHVELENEVLHKGAIEMESYLTV